MFQKKLNLTPLGPGLPKIQACVAIQKINSSVNMPVTPVGSLGLSAGLGVDAASDLQWVLWLFAPQNYQHGRKVLSGSVPGDFRVVKLLFNFLCSPKSMLRTHHAAGKTANKNILQLLRGFKGDTSPKSPAPSPPACQQLQPWQWERENCSVIWGSHCWKQPQPSLPKHWGLFTVFFKWSF